MLATVSVDWRWALKPSGLRYGCLLVIEYAPRYPGELNPRASMWVDCGANADKSDFGLAEPVQFTACSRLRPWQKNAMVLSLRRKESGLRALYAPSPVLPIKKPVKGPCPSRKAI